MTRSLNFLEIGEGSRFMAEFHEECRAEGWRLWDRGEAPYLGLVSIIYGREAWSLIAECLTPDALEIAVEAVVPGEGFDVRWRATKAMAESAELEARIKKRLAA